jgi:hypothetical protein
LKVIPLSMVLGDLDGLASRLEILDLALYTIQDRAKNGELEEWELETIHRGVMGILGKVAKLRGWAAHGIPPAGQTALKGGAYHAGADDRVHRADVPQASTARPPAGAVSRARKRG